MRIEIHDVDHGGCAVVTSAQGHRLMLDCGQSLTRPWFPSVSYMGERIDTLMLLNLDEDHVEDLNGLWSSCPIGAIVSNPTVSPQALLSMKAEGMRSGVRTAFDIFRAFGGGRLGNWQHDLGGIHWHAFWNVYGRDFTDTNNLSLAVFVTCDRFTVLFGGDLETAGWKKLLEMPLFRARLSHVNTLVASHHGRENGKCADLFECCQPELIIFSDGPKQFETQETAAWYGGRAKGIPDWTRPAGPLGLRPLRRVMTTRKDGTIRLEQGSDGRWWAHRQPRGGFDAGALLSRLSALPQPTRSRGLLG